MAAEFVTNKNVDAVIATEAPGHVFAAGTEIWLGQSVALDFLRLCSLIQANQTDGILDKDLTR